MKNLIPLGFLLAALALFGPACNQNSKSSTPALKLTAKDIWLSNEEDLDGDGYASYPKLNMDLDANRSSIDVFVEIYVRPHDPADTSDYFFYYGSPAFTIGGEGSEDAVYISMGKPNPELLQAEWDFGVLVYLDSDPQNPVLGFDFSDVAAFGAVAMEELVTDGGILIYDAWWYNGEDIDGDGFYSKSSLAVDVDVPSGDSLKYVYLDLYVKTVSSSNYTKYGSTDFFRIDGESETDAVGIPLDDTFSHDTYDFRIAAMVYNGDVTEDMVDKSTSGVIGEELGAVPLELANEDVLQPLTLYFTNQVFTPIDISLLNYGSKTIPVGGDVSWYFASNPGMVRYSASTSGRTNQGTQVGKLVTWQATLPVSGLTTQTYNLVLSSDEFYIYMKNSGSVTFNSVIANADLADQTTDNIIIPNDNITYNIGYYNAHANTEVRAMIQNGGGSYIYWQQGNHFTLPFTENQSVVLLNTYKAGADQAAAEIHTGKVVPEAVSPVLR